MPRPNQNKSDDAASVRDAAAHVGQNLRDAGEQVRETAAEQYEQLRDQASEYYEQGRQRAMDMEQTLEQYVQEKPLRALLIAAGIGMFVGMVWKRR